MGRLLSVYLLHFIIAHIRHTSPSSLLSHPVFSPPSLAQRHERCIACSPGGHSLHSHFPVLLSLFGCRILTVFFVADTNVFKLSLHMTKIFLLLLMELYSHVLFFFFFVFKHYSIYIFLFHSHHLNSLCFTVYSQQITITLISEKCRAFLILYSS